MRQDYHYTFYGVAEITHLLSAYLMWKTKEPKTLLAPIGVRLASELLGVTLTRDWKWRFKYSLEITNRRLNSAGVNPNTWEIIDRRRAAWCWYQLKTTKRYSEKRQETLMASREEPPPLEIPLTFPSRNIRKRVLEREQRKNTEQDFSRKIREHFE